MLPKKGRKEIIIDDVLYYYTVNGYVNVVIHNSETGEIIKWYDEVKPKWQVQVKPSDIEKIIRDHNKSSLQKENS